MKKLTPVLICLLAVFVGALFSLNFLGITEPVLYYSQYETAAVQQAPPVLERENIRAVSIPSYYNCMDAGKINRTRDQGELGACWAFAANAALESRLLPEEKWDFSEDHMIYNNGFYNNSTEGGDFFMAVAYLTSWKGPVAEEQDPYNDGNTDSTAAAVKHLQEAVFLNDGDFDIIKKMVYCYGAVESSIHISVDEGQYIDETYYDRNQYSYCYDGDEEPNHEIVIIGWDDDYSRDNFKTGADRDGAFICLNSWGTEFGNYGVFYVSYSDTCIGRSAEVYTVIEDSGNYHHNYQYDDYGWVGRMGFEDPHAFFANVYTAEGKEELDAVAFYATNINTDYKVYVCSNFSSVDQLLSGRKLLAQGTLDFSGYYTISLDSPVSLEPGERFAVIVEINTPDSNHPVAIEMDGGDGRTGRVILDGKESYISANGRIWENTQKDSSCNVCLKAFTRNR